MYITISGIIGAGKTTLAKHISQYFKQTLRKKNVFTMFEKPEENAYLEQYYAGQDVAFKMESQFMAQRICQGVEIDARLSQDPEAIIIQDRSSIEDYHIFVQHQLLLGQLSMGECASLYRLHAFNPSHLVKPDLMLFVDTRPEVALERVRQRDRESERNMTLHFLEDIYMLENVMIDEHMPKDYPGTEIVRLPGNGDNTAFEAFTEHYYKNMKV